MKTSPSSVLALSITLFLAVSTVVRIAAVEPSAAPAAPQMDKPRPTSAELVSKVYLALVKESIVPANPRVVASAALAALPSERVRPFPDGFGTDASRDAAWLAECVADLPSPWPVLDAMVRATRTAHTGLVSPQMGQGMRALGSGRPLSAPGFRFYPLADGRLVAFDLNPGASADVGGLRPGDVLRLLNGRPILPLDQFRISTLPAGMEVTLDIERAGQAMTILLRLVPADVSPVESRLLDDGIAYISIRWFARTEDTGRDAAALVRSALTSLAAQGARGLILDLRSALGGSGEVSIASALYDGDVIYSIRQPLSAPVRPVRRMGERCWPDRPVIVLVNELTVSAGEDLALSLRELGQAKIVGRTSAGGLTELSRVPLADNYVMVIPTGVVLGPVSGADQPGHVIRPDIEVPNPTIEELLSGRDRQLDAARAVLTPGR